MNYEEHRAQQQASREAKMKRRENEAAAILTKRAIAMRAFYQKRFTITKLEMIDILKEHGILPEDTAEIITIHCGFDGISIEVLKHESDL